MKKIFKITGVILAIFIILFIVLAIWGMNDSKKEEELAKSNINNEISFEGDFSDLDTSKDWAGKHIVVSGKIDNVESLHCTLINNDFVIKAYCDNIPEDIVKDGIATIDGVCTYQSSNKIRMRNCAIVDFKKIDKTSTNKEANSDVSVEKETSTEKNENSTASKKTKPEQGTVKIDSEWYKKCNVFTSENQEKLELIWYDDKGIDISINDTTTYHFDSKNYETSSDGNAVYTCNDGTEFIYYPNDNSVEIKNVIYKNIHLSTENISNDNLDDIKKFLVDTLGDSTVKSVELVSWNDTVNIRVYFERKSILFSTDELKMSVLDTAYETLKVYNNYINSNDSAPENVDVIACFPNDGKDNADKDCFQVVCRRSDLEKFDFTSSDNSQMEDYAYVSKWFIGIK